MGGWTSSLTIVSSDLCVHLEKNSILGIMNSLTHGKAKGGLYCVNKRTRNKLVAKHIHKMLKFTILQWMVYGAT